MTDTSEYARRRHGDGLFSVVSVGFFFLLIGMIFITTPGLSDRIVSFFQDFGMIQFPHTNVYLPAPKNPGDYLAVYKAVEQFSLVWAVFLVAMLVGRIVLRVRLRRQAANLGDAVFWFGAAYLIQAYLIDKMTNSLHLATQRQVWFEFWTGIIVIIGVSLIARAVFLAVVRKSAL